MWIIDSGASRHMCAQKSVFKNLRPSNVKSISMANSNKIPVEGEGEVTLTCKTPDGHCEVFLSNVLCVPEIVSNLVSISCMTKNKARITFHKNSCSVKNAANQMVMLAKQIYNGIYQSNLSNNSSNSSTPRQPTLLTATTNSAKMFTWHRRLAHLNYRSLSQLAEYADGIQISDKETPFCRPCTYGKNIKNPFQPSTKKSNAVLELLHTDLCEIRPTSIEGHNYFMVVSDDYSRMIFAFLFERKCEAAKPLEDFIIFAQKQTGKPVKAIRSDNGREYVNSHLTNFTKRLGIDHQLTVPGNSQSKTV